MQVLPLGGKDPWKKVMETCSNILARKVPWTEEPGGLQPMESQRVGYNLVTKHLFVSIFFTFSLVLC